MPEKYHIVQEESVMMTSSSTESLMQTVESPVMTMDNKPLLFPPSSHSHSLSHSVPHSKRLTSPAQSFAVKRVMNAVGVTYPLPTSASVESLERCIYYNYNYNFNFYYYFILSNDN